MGRQWMGMPFSLMQETDMEEGTGESGAGKQAPCRRLHAPLTHAARMTRPRCGRHTAASICTIPCEHGSQETSSWTAVSRLAGKTP